MLTSPMIDSPSSRSRVGNLRVMSWSAAAIVDKETMTTKIVKVTCQQRISTVKPRPTHQTWAGHYSTDVFVGDRTEREPDLLSRA